MDSGFKKIKNIMEKYFIKNRNMYTNTLKNKKDNHESVGWGSKISQIKRFNVLSQIVPDFKNLNILDVGCGVGHLLDYLLENDFSGKYQGIDILQEMIDISKERHPAGLFKKQELQFIGDENFDYIWMSGIFTLADDVVLENTILNAFRVCKLGIAFNSLSSWASQKEAGEFYADPIKTLDFCSGLTKNVVLRHDYLPHDFTIYMYK